MLGFVNRTTIQCILIYATKRLRNAGHDHCKESFSFCHIVRSHDVDLLIDLIDLTGSVLTDLSMV